MSINPLSGIGGSTGAVPATKQQSLGQDEFLELMMAQFQNQDPFKPMENGEFLGQMAQFSTVQGLDELNAKFEGLASSLGGNQAVGAAQLIGHNALFETNSLSLDQAGESISGRLQTDRPGNVTVDILDSSGQLVRRMGLESNGTGATEFSWDGRNQAGESAAAGHYYVNAYSAMGGGQEAVPVWISARIEGVSMGGARGALLNVANLGEQSLNDVKQISDFGAKE